MPAALVIARNERRTFPAASGVPVRVQKTRSPSSHVLRGTIQARVPGSEHDHECHHSGRAATVAVFANAAAHLEPGGCFVVEVIVPQLRQVPPGGGRPGVHL